MGESRQVAGTETFDIFRVQFSSGGDNVPCFGIKSAWEMKFWKVYVLCLQTGRERLQHSRTVHLILPLVKYVLFIFICYNCNFTPARVLVCQSASSMARGNSF